MFGLNNKSPMSTFSKSMAPRGNTDVLRTPDSFLRPFEQGVVPEAFLGATSTPICDSRNGYPPKPGLSLLESLRSPLISNVPDLISRKGGKKWNKQMDEIGYKISMTEKKVICRSVSKLAHA